MIVTEEEAKTKACGGGHGCGGRMKAVTVDGLLAPICIGSACMAWRWAIEWADESRHERRASKTHGYCGKAGKP